MINFNWKLLGLINTQNIKKTFWFIKTYGFADFLFKFREKTSSIKPEKLYRQWIKNNEPTVENSETQRKTIFQHKPTISIIVPILNTPKRYLANMLESVLRQTYPNWELCIVDSENTKIHIRESLEGYAKKESRIHLKFIKENKGIAGKSNEALSLVTGDFVAFLGCDGILPPFALFEVVKAINEYKDADFLYSDEDKIISDTKKRVDPHFKPDWSPDMILSCNYIGHLSVIKKNILDEIGSFREEYEGSQDYDLFLRASRRAKNIVHIPKVLYHSRVHRTSVSQHEDTGIYSITTAKKAIIDHLGNNGYSRNVMDGPIYTTYRISYEIKSSPMVSIIIPTKDMVQILGKCISSILEKTTYTKYKILILNNSSKEIETYKYYEQIKKNPRVSIVDYNKPFNYSAINNFAVSQVDSAYILFLNNDVEIINKEWLSSMLEHAQRKEVGAVGAKLYYPDGTIQHGGVIIGLGGIAGHSHKFFPGESSGYFSRLKIIQNLSAVTGACLMTRKEVFEEVAGFDERYSHAYNDIDFCLKIRDKGYLIIWTPYAELYHHESKSRGYDDTPEKQNRDRNEAEQFRKKWHHVLRRGDPYYSPNLTIKREDFSLRVEMPKGKNSS